MRFKSHKGGKTLSVSSNKKLIEYLEKESLIRKVDEDTLRIGSYIILKTAQGWRLIKDSKELGTYPKAIIKEDRVLLAKNMGMLLEVTPQRHREILSIHKARLIAGVCGDGSLSTKGTFEMKFINSDDNLLKMYIEALEKVYGIRKPSILYDYRKGKPVAHVKVTRQSIVEDVYKYCKKRGAKYWVVPLEYLDREAAIEFLSFYYSCDGSYDYRPRKGTREIIFKSCSLNALHGIKRLLETHLGAESHFRKPEYDKRRGELYYRLVVSRVDNLRKLFLHGFTSYRTDHQRVLNEIKRWALGES